MLEYEQDQAKGLLKSVSEKILGSGILKLNQLNDPQREEEVWNYLKDISLFIHQRSCFITSILSSLLNQKMAIIDTINGYLKTMKEMHAMLIYKTAINSKDIFVRIGILHTDY